MELNTREFCESKCERRELSFKSHNIPQWKHRSFICSNFVLQNVFKYRFYFVQNCSENLLLLLMWRSEYLNWPLEFPFSCCLIECLTYIIHLFIRSSIFSNLFLMVRNRVSLYWKIKNHAVLLKVQEANYSPSLVCLFKDIVFRVFPPTCLLGERVLTAAIYSYINRILSPKYAERVQ